MIHLKYFQQNWLAVQNTHVFNMVRTQSRTLTFQKNCFICFNESLLKVMKNAFYFILKALFAHKIFKFLSWLFGHVEKLLNEKDKLISKFMTSQPG